MLEKFKRREALKSLLTENYYDMSKFKSPSPYFRNGVVREGGRKVVWD